MTTMRIMCLTILFVIHLQVIFISAEDNYKHLPLHKRMDPTLLKQTFDVESYDKVPEYEVVQVRPVPVGSTRSAVDEGEVRRVHLTAFGSDMQLQLHKNDHFDARLKTMNMYMAESTNNGIEYKEMDAEDDDPGTPYQDLDQMAAVIIRDGSDGEIQMEGTIGNDLVVKPVPTAILLSEDGFVDDEMFLDEDESYEGTRNSTWYHPQGYNNSSRHTPPQHKRGAHFVYRKQTISYDWHSRFEILPMPLGLEGPEHAMCNILDRFPSGFLLDPPVNPSRRTKRAVPWPSAVYPEILILVDYQHFVQHGSQIKRYVASFWNGVDLRFKTLSNPKIWISLAGVIVAKSKDATPFLERHRFPSPNRDTFKGWEALHDMGKYLYLERNRMPTYDLAVFMTKLDMCKVKDSAGTCNRMLIGTAFTGGACLVDKMRKKVISVAIIEDTDGIITAAHEVGHLLGSNHDGENNELGGPGGFRCGGMNGFIMESSFNDDVVGFWSNCSVEQFRYFFSLETSSCLLNYPEVNKLQDNTHVTPANKPQQPPRRARGCKDHIDEKHGYLHCQKLLTSLNVHSFCGNDFVIKNCCLSHQIVCPIQG